MIDPAIALLFRLLAYGAEVVPFLDKWLERGYWNWHKAKSERGTRKRRKAEERVNRQFIADLRRETRRLAGAELSETVVKGAQDAAKEVNPLPQP